MENLDNNIEDATLQHHDEDELFLQHVVQDNHELLFLDVCLNEICRQKQQENRL